jgi:glutathione peroxidase
MLASILAESGLRVGLFTSPHLKDFRERIKVNGKDRHPLYQELTKVPDSAGKAGRVQWNFEKFLVTPDDVVHRFRPTTVPDDPEIVATIEAALSSRDG